MSFFTNKFLPKPDSSVIGIDIGSSSLKIVQIKKEKDRAVLQTYGEISFGSYNNLPIGQTVNLTSEQYVKVILDLLKEANITATKSAMSIPLKLSLISFLDIPKVDEKEERGVIEFEARKYIPVSMSEVTLDYFIIPQADDSALDTADKTNIKDTVKTTDTVNMANTENAVVSSEIKQIDDNNKVSENLNLKKRQKVLLAAIHNQVLDNYSKIAQGANLSIDSFEVEAFATSRGCLRSETTPVMIVDSGASSTKAYVIENGLLVASHVINRGGQDVSFTISKSLDIPFEHAESLKRSLGKTQIANEAKIKEVIASHEDYIFSELKVVFSTFQKTKNVTISKIILTGGSSLLDGFKDRLKQNFYCEVELASPFSKLDAPISLQETLKSRGTTFATAIGSALRAL
jgi:type IV pilus assembly protein PilM